MLAVNQIQLLQELQRIQIEYYLFTTKNYQMLNLEDFSNC